MLQAIIDHGLLAAALAIAYWWATPHLVKKTLLNGGGVVIRAHIEAANAAQSAETARVVGMAIERHEAQEFRQYGQLGEGQVYIRETVAGLSAKLDAHLLNGRPT